MDKSFAVNEVHAPLMLYKGVARLKGYQSIVLLTHSGEESQQIMPSRNLPQAVPRMWPFLLSFLIILLSFSAEGNDHVFRRTSKSGCKKAVSWEYYLVLRSFLTPVLVQTAVYALATFDSKR